MWTEQKSMQILFESRAEKQTLFAFQRGFLCIQNKNSQQEA